MPRKKIKFEIVTPERTVLKEEILSLVLPTESGEITILPHHIPLISVLKPGEIRIKTIDGERLMAISGGFVEVMANSRVVILADTAEMAEEIDIKRAEEAQQRAEALLKEKKVDSQEFAILAAKLQKQLARLKVARKYKRIKK